MCELDKPLRLIELFAGYGSQALSLKYLNIPFEHWFVCDFDKYAIQSYNDIHNTNYKPIDITKISASDLGIENTNTYDYLKSTKIGYIQNNELVVRLLTPKEHLRLMGVRDNEINKFSVNSNQQIKQAGNSIVVNVLIAIFKNLFINKKYENTLF